MLFLYSTRDASRVDQGMSTPVAESFEAAMQELESIVRDLENSKMPLAAAVAAYERGVALQQYCRSQLEEAQLKIETLTPSVQQA